MGGFERMELSFYDQVSMARCVRAILLLDACQSPCVFPRRIWQQVLHLLRRFHDTKRVSHLCDLPLLVITMHYCDSLMELSLSWLAHD